MHIISSRPSATATIKGSKEAPLLKGMIRFYQRPNGILIEAELSGLPNNESGFFGFHIHTGKSCTGADFLNTGGHYNPDEQRHPRHAGDLPPLLSYGTRAYMAVVSDRFSMAEIIGKTIVVHGAADDFYSQPSGNAGTKIGCGEIKRFR